MLIQMNSFYIIITYEYQQRSNNLRTKFDIYDFIFDIVSVQLGSEYDMHILHTQYIDECYDCKIFRSKIRASTHQSSVLNMLIQMNSFYIIITYEYQQRSNNL
jgi:hypothetical protein